MLSSMDAFEVPIDGSIEFLGMQNYLACLLYLKLLYDLLCCVVSEIAQALSELVHPEDNDSAQA